MHDSLFVHAHDDCGDLEQCIALAIETAGLDVDYSGLTDIATAHPHGHPSTTRPKLDQGFGIGPLLLFGGLLAAGILYTAYSLYSDTSASQVGTADPRLEHAAL